jgi:hypothetical protein
MAQMRRSWQLHRCTCAVRALLPTSVAARRALLLM